MQPIATVVGLDEGLNVRAEVIEVPIRFGVDACAPAIPFRLRRVSTVCKTPLKKSTSRTFSANTRLSWLASFRRVALREVSGGPLLSRGSSFSRHVYNSRRLMPSSFANSTMLSHCVSKVVDGSITPESIREFCIREGGERRAHDVTIWQKCKSSAGLSCLFRCSGLSSSIRYPNKTNDIDQRNLTPTTRREMVLVALFPQGPYALRP